MKVRGFPWGNTVNKSYSLVCCTETVRGGSCWFVLLRGNQPPPFGLCRRPLRGDVRAREGSGPDRGGDDADRVRPHTGPEQKGPKGTAAQPQRRGRPTSRSQWQRRPEASMVRGTAQISHVLDLLRCARHVMV